MKKGVFRSLNDKIINSVMTDDLDKLVPLVTELRSYMGNDSITKPSRFKSNFYGKKTPVNNFQTRINDYLYRALYNGSEKTVYYLLECGGTVNLNNNPLQSCKYDIIKDVYELCEKISKDKKLPFNCDKKIIVKRILEPYKIETNPDRITYLFDLYKEGFIEIKMVRDTIEEDYKSIDKKSVLKTLMRDLLLTELGIE